MEGWYGRIFRGCGFFDPDKPIRKYTKRELQALLYKEPTKIKVEGINLTYTGLIPTIQKSFLSKDVDAMQPHIRAFVERAVTFATCPECDGTRLSAEARSSKIGKINIADACAMQISDLAVWVGNLDEPSVAPLLNALRHTLDSFVEIGLGYLSLERPAGTLSGGEAQRTKMIRHLGSSLTDVTYVFDEPTIGLHPHDIQRMNELLLQLRDKGNTVLVVEHKPEAIAIGDHVVDLGPGAGAAGGEVVFEGTVDGLRASDTLTGRHLDDRATREAVGPCRVRRPGDPGSEHPQPADVDVDIPLGVLTVITGVAGSGKSSLIRGSVSDRDGRGLGRPGRRSRGHGAATRRRTRAARSHPQGVRQGQRRQAGAVQRQLRGRLPQLQRRGGHLHRPGHDGRCRHGLRGVRRQAVRRVVLDYTFGGRDISEVLAMSVAEAEEFFGGRRGARRRPPTRSSSAWRTSASAISPSASP